MRSALSKAHLPAEQYLREMEVPQAVYLTMTQTPPDDVRLLDWVAAKALFGGLSAKRALIEKYDQTRPDFGVAPACMIGFDQSVQSTA